jgi:hypothetical protein
MSARPSAIYVVGGGHVTLSGPAVAVPVRSDATPGGTLKRSRSTTGSSPSAQCCTITTSDA